MLALRRLLPALLLVVVVLAGLAVWWTQVRFPARTVRIPALVRVTLHVQDRVSAPDLDAIERGLVAGNRYLRAIGAGGLEDHVDVRVADGDGCHAFAAPGAHGVGQTEKGFVCLDLRAPAWAWQRAHAPLGLLGTPAHELVHARQAELGCLADGDGQRWRWLLEGSAVDLSSRALVRAGLQTDAQAAATIRRYGAFARDVRPLRAYERGSGGDHAYALYHLAVRDLLRRSGATPADELRFCARAGTGAGWRRAFREVFGISVAAFYRDFARALPRYRRGAAAL